MRILIFTPAAILAAAGCQTAGHGAAPIEYVGRARTQPLPQVSTAPAPIIGTPYETFALTAVLGELRACHTAISNPGPLDDWGASAVYTPWINAPSGVLLRAPLQAACLSSGYGYRERAAFPGAIKGGGRAHTGLDLANSDGGYIYAAADGLVAAVGWRGDYGLVVELDHGAGVRTVYAHLSETDPRLTVGALAPYGYAIGRMGATGNATGVHLHYEVIVDGIKVDPLTYGPPGPVS